jgi:KDO2-lipid IV(A) lauroyltransferase
MPAARKRSNIPLWSPYYWPTWLAVGVLRVLEWLPYPWMLRVGRGLGGMARVLAPGLRRIVNRNLQLCFPEMPATERATLLAQHFRALGESLSEFAMSWWSSSDRVRKLVTVEGLEHLDAAHARGRGVILLSAHFTSLEITARAMTTLRPVCALYKKLSNAALASVVDRGRARAATRAIPYDDIRSMVSALRNGEIVWYAPDQSFRKKGALMVPFLGVPAASNPNTSRLAQLTGSAVLYMSHERLPDAQGYRIRVHPVWENYPSGDDAADVERLHRCIEADVRRQPAQYWWIHKRFKGLSADYPDYYARSAPPMPRTAANQLPQ